MFFLNVIQDMVPVWLLLIPFLVIYCVKEVFIMGMYKRKYLRRMSSYRNISIILSTVALIYDGPPGTIFSLCFLKDPFRAWKPILMS